MIALSAGLTANSLAAEEPAAKSSMRDVPRARLTAEAKAKAAPPAAPTPPNPMAKAAPVAAATPATGAPAPTETTEKKAVAKSVEAEQPPTILPKVEVRKTRITELDRQISQQEQLIAREKKNTKASEVDRALNDAKIAKPLAIFGGQSDQNRVNIAQERVSLLEAERDIMEAIAHAKTKPEKEELQKQLEQFRAMRRDLDKSLR